MFHLGLSLHKGYLGVDIFFVISGYVISLRAFYEIQTTKKFNLGGFFARRSFRLLPALSVMLCLSAILSFFFQTPFQPVGQQQVTAKTGLSSLLFIANIEIPKISSGYFGTLAQNNAMTHLWSTSVEAQFYLFFALTLIFLLKLRFGKKGILNFFSLIAVLSAMLYFNGSDSEVFFKTLYRAWEFILGVILALTVLKLSKKDLDRRLVAIRWISFTSIFLIILGQLSFSPNLSNFQLVLTLIGTCTLLFLTALAPNHPLGRLMENKNLVMVGNASYSIYLWHWPLIIFFGLTWQNSGLKSLILIPTSIGLGIASYNLVERKFKYIPKQSKIYASKILTLILAAAISLSILGYGAKTGWGISWFGLSNPPRNSLGACMPYSAEDPICSIQSKSHKKKLFLIGDSQAESVAKPFMSLAKQKGWDFFLISDAGGAYLDARCKNIIDCEDTRTESLLRIKPDYIVIANLWNLQKSPDKAKRDLEQKLMLPLKLYPELKGTQFVLVSPIPIVSNFNNKFTYFNKYILKNWQFNPENNSYQNAVRLIFREELRSEINFSVVDTYGKICDNVPCSLLESGVSLYRDSSHLTPQGAFFAIGNLSWLR